MELPHQPFRVQPIPFGKTADVTRVTRPGIIFDSRYNSRLDGVLMNVSGQCECVAVCLNERAFITALEQWTDAFVIEVDVPDIITLKSLHCVVKVGQGGLEK